VVRRPSKSALATGIVQFLSTSYGPTYSQLAVSRDVLLVSASIPIAARSRHPISS